MRIYMASVYKNGYTPGEFFYNELNDYEKVIASGFPYLLESYHYVDEQKYVDNMRRDGKRVFLDSGAFSAMTLGVEINIQEYCSYIQRNRDILLFEDGVLMASVLDGIGDPLKTWNNQQHMEYLGAKPLPCFHYGEDERYLEHYVTNYPYITIGGMVGKARKQLEIWLDRIWSKFLIDGNGKPKLKVHAFGVTTVSLMEDYPWHSCDSSSWIQSAAFGSIITPEHGALSISSKSPSRHDEGRHFTTLKPVEQEHLKNMFEQQGFNFERLANVYQSRAAYNMWSFWKVNERINASKTNRFSTLAQELF